MVTMVAAAIARAAWLAIKQTSRVAVAVVVVVVVVVGEYPIIELCIRVAKTIKAITTFDIHIASLELYHPPEGALVCGRYFVRAAVNCSVSSAGWCAEIRVAPSFVRKWQLCKKCWGDIAEEYHFPHRMHSIQYRPGKSVQFYYRELL